jgi:hypothetical protein
LFADVPETAAVVAFNTKSKKTVVTIPLKNTFVRSSAWLTVVQPGHEQRLNQTVVPSPIRLVPVRPDPNPNLQSLLKVYRTQAMQRKQRKQDLSSIVIEQHRAAVKHEAEAPQVTQMQTPTLPSLMSISQVQDEPEGTMTNVNVVHSEREKPKRKRRTPEEMRIFKAQQDKEAYERVLQSSSAPSSSTAVTKLRTHRHNTHTHTHTHLH